MAKFVDMGKTPQVLMWILMGSPLEIDGSGHGWLKHHRMDTNLKCGARN